MEHQVPAVNLADFLSKGLSAIDQAALVRACEDHGFFLLAEHGQEQLVADVFAQAEKFLCATDIDEAQRVQKRRKPVGLLRPRADKQASRLKRGVRFARPVGIFLRTHCGIAVGQSSRNSCGQH